MGSGVLGFQGQTREDESSNIPCLEFRGFGLSGFVLNIV